ncbi:MAG: helix-turn-helix domain-containing protein [Bacteroidia bacterium]
MVNHVSRQSKTLKLIASNIKAIRKEKNISKKELADRLNLEVNDIEEIESGKYDMKIKTIEAITIVLKIHILDLFN